MFCCECGRPLKENETCDCINQVHENPNVKVFIPDNPTPSFGMLTNMVDVSLEICKDLNGNWSTKDKKHKIVFELKKFTIDDITVYVEAYPDNTLRFVNMYPDKIKFNKIEFNKDTITVYYDKEKLVFKKDK